MTVEELKRLSALAEAAAMWAEDLRNDIETLNCEVSFEDEDLEDEVQRADAAVRAVIDALEKAEAIIDARLGDATEEEEEKEPEKHTAEETAA